MSVVKTLYSYVCVLTVPSCVCKHSCATVSLDVRYVLPINVIFLMIFSLNQLKIYTGTHPTHCEFSQRFGLLFKPVLAMPKTPHTHAYAHSDVIVIRSICACKYLLIC